jgi:hypothetical protein
MFEAVQNGDAPKWIAIEQAVGQGNNEDALERLRQVFEDGEQQYTACVDFPACTYYRELMQVQYTLTTFLAALFMTPKRNRCAEHLMSRQSCAKPLQDVELAYVGLYHNVTC